MVTIALQRFDLAPRVVVAGKKIRKRPSGGERLIASFVWLSLGASDCCVVTVDGATVTGEEELPVLAAGMPYR